MKKFHLFCFAMLSIISTASAYRIGGGLSSNCIMATDNQQTLFIALYQLPEVDSENPMEQRISIINTDNGESISWFNISYLNELENTVMSINTTSNRIKLINGDNTYIYDYHSGEIIPNDQTEFIPLTIITETSIELNNINILKTGAGEYIDVANDVGCFLSVIYIENRATYKLLNIVPETYIGKGFYDGYCISTDKSKIAFLGLISEIYTEDYCLSIYDINSKTIERYLLEQNNAFIGFNYDKSRLVVQGEHNKVLYYDYKNKIFTDSVEYGVNEFIVNVPNNFKYIFVLSGNSLKVFNQTSNELISSFLHTANMGFFNLSEDSKFLYEYYNGLFISHNLENSERTVIEIPNFATLISNTHIKQLAISNDGRYILTKYLNTDNESYFASWSVAEDKIIKSKEAGINELNSVTDLKYLIAPYSITYSVNHQESIASLNEIDFKLANLINGKDCVYPYEFLIEPLNNGTQVLSYGCGGVLLLRQACEQAISGVNDQVTGVGNIELYPNPTKDKLTIKSLQAGINIINVVSSNGEIVSTITKFQTETSEFTFDLKNLNSGNYIIEVINGIDKKTGKICVVK